MNWIIYIILFPFIICKYLYLFFKELFVDSIMECFKNRHRFQQIIEKFRNYDNLSEEEKTIDSTDGLEEEHYKVLNEIVKTWFDKKLLDEDRCRFVSDVSTNLLKKLIVDIDKIAFTSTDYKQLICVYEYINKNRPWYDYFDCTLECAEYIRRYWLESGEKPLPITDMATLGYFKMGNMSLKDLENLRRLKMENDQRELCYYITNLEMFRKKIDTSVHVQLSLYADRIEIYEPSEDDVYDENYYENHNIVIKKGKNETVLLQDIDDIKFNDWEEVKAYYELESKKQDYKDRLEYYKERSEDKAYKNMAREYERVSKEIGNQANLIKEFLLEISCVDGNVYSFSDAREPEALILRALILYFIQKAR